MPGRRRDVELVIRARDAASKTVDAVSGAIRDLGSEQSRLSNSANQTDSALDRLGSTFRNLSSNLRGLTVVERLETEFNKAEGAIKRLEGSVRDSVSENDRLAASVQRAEREYESLTAAANQAQAAVDRERASKAESRAEQTRANRELRAGVTARDRLTRSEERLEASIVKQNATLREATARYDRLKNEIAETEAPTKRLQQTFERSGTAIDRARARLEGLESSLAETRSNSAAAATSVEQLEAAALTATNRFEAQNNALAEAQQRYREFGNTAKAAGANLTSLRSDAERLEASIEQQTGELAKARTEYRQFGAALDQVEGQMRQLQSSTAAALAQEFREQELAVAATRREYDEASNAALRLGQRLGQLEQEAAGSIFNQQAVQDVARLTQEYEEQNVVLARSRSELQLQETALRELGQITEATGGDVTELTERTRRFAEVQEQTARSLATLRAQSDRQLSSLREQSAAAGQAAAGQRELGSAVRTAGGALNTQRGQVSALSTAYQRLYGETRRSLSLQQRLRGEVLSLVAAYTGFFGAIEGIRGVSRAVQELEQAQLKFSIAFSDPAIADSQLQFARELAIDLALDIGVVTDRYAALQIAARSTNLSVRDTEELFIGLAQASRALNLTQEQQGRVFTAVQQIVQKGVVSMEELRQQLGETLPGAMAVFAEAAGFGTDEIDEFSDAVAQGAISADILSDVGAILQRDFGPAAASATDSLAAAIGRASNQFRIFREFLGAQGVTQGLTNFFDSLATTLSDPAFTAFGARLAAGIGNVLTLLGRLAENFELVIRTISLLVGLRLASVFTPLIAGAIQSSRGLLQLVASLRTAQGAVASLRGSFIALRGAINAALISTGIGAGIVVLTTLFGEWLTSVDQTTAALEISNRALEGHAEILSRVQEAYDAANGSSAQFQQNLTDIADLTAVELQRNADALRDAILETVSQLEGVLEQGRSGFGGGQFIDNRPTRQFRREIEALANSAADGDIALSELRQQISEVSVQYRDASEGNRLFADALDETLSPLSEQIDAFNEALQIIQAKTGAEEDAEQAALDLGLAQEQAADQAVVALERQRDGAEQVRNALTQMADTIPRFAQNLEELEEVTALEKIYRDALQVAESMGEVLALTQGFNDAVANINVGAGFDAISGASDGIEASAALIREFEGFISTPQFDVNAFRVGFGSDTITLSDGTVQKVTEGISVTVEDSNRDLLRRITTEFQPRVIERVGEAQFRALAPQQQAVLNSIAFNFGNLPQSVARAIRDGGSDEEVAQAIRNLANITDRQASLNEGQRAGLRRRRAQEANKVRADEQAAQAAERRREAQEQFTESQAQSLAQQQFENGLVDQNVIDREVALALREAEIEAAAVGLELTDAQRESIVAVTTEKFRQQAADDAAAATAERTAEAEARVNSLISQRGDLERQLEIFRSEGDTEAASSAEEEIRGINEQLTAAIDNAIAMWQAIGGGESEAAIARLQTARLEAQGLGQEGENNEVTWTRVGEVFAGGLLSAFDNFAQSVAQGASIGEAARNAFLQFASDFLRQIAQMIIQQALLNALQGFSGGGGGFGQFITGALTGIAHTGGVVGNRFTGSNGGRRVNPAVFAGAPRFHEGGLPGLRPNEVATILQRGEEVVTADDPRHARNGGLFGGGSSGGMDVKVVNAIDGPGVLDMGLQDSRGQEVILNFIRNNSGAVRAAIGG